MIRVKVMRYWVWEYINYYVKVELRLKEPRRRNSLKNITFRLSLSYIKNHSTFTRLPWYSSFHPHQYRSTSLRCFISAGEYHIQVPNFEAFLLPSLILSDWFGTCAHWQDSGAAFQPLAGQMKGIDRTQFHQTLAHFTPSLYIYC